ncbi:acyl carrier protein [Allokutzneria albata]|uniref:acyl carrier protein n=1 Tax=Allokutzneria albata TaxID=211114 RepID=UPI0009DF928A|nr:acyl carrier protein [Allokutzneria albata]
MPTTRDRDDKSDDHWGIKINDFDDASRAPSAAPAQLSTECAGVEPWLAPVRDAWTEVLGHGNFDDEANFFEVGGHSLRATLMLRSLRRRTGVAVGVRTVFDNPTIRALAGALAEKAGAGGAASKVVEN